MGRGPKGRAPPYGYVSKDNGFSINLTFIYTLFSQSLFGVWSLFGTNSCLTFCEADAVVVEFSRPPIPKTTKRKEKKKANIKENNLMVMGSFFVPHDSEKVHRLDFPSC